jgi:hypothetical protein
MVLRSSTIGLSYRNKEITPYISLHGTLPEGNVIFSINWKNIAAFRAWRNGQGEEVPQEEIHAAIYFLTFEISKLL